MWRASSDRAPDAGLGAENREVVWESLARCGVARMSADDTLHVWGPRDLHLLIAHFLRLRFPIVLALNKAELPTVS